MTGWLGLRAKKFQRTPSLFFQDFFSGVAVTDRKVPNINRQPSQKVIFYRQQSKMQIEINRQKAYGISNLIISGSGSWRNSGSWRIAKLKKPFPFFSKTLFRGITRPLWNYIEILQVKGLVNLQNTTVDINQYRSTVNMYFNIWTVCVSFRLINVNRQNWKKLPSAVKADHPIETNLLHSRF